MKLSIYGWAVFAVGALFRLVAETTYALAAIARSAWDTAFPAAAVTERNPLPTLRSNETSIQSRDRAAVRSFRPRVIARTDVGRGSGEPGYSAAVAFAA